MPNARSLWRIEPVTFAVIFTWLMAIAPSLLRDPGTFWHIRVGDWIFEANEIIRADPFSATRHGEAWVPVSWLAECLFSLLHRLGGLDAIVVVTAAALAWLYASVAQRLAAGGVQAPVVVFLVALVVAASSHHFHARPHVATLALFGWMFAGLVDFEAARVSVKSLLWFVAVVALWANLHGGVAGGLATFALCGAGWTAAWLAGFASPLRTTGDFARVALVGVACIAATLVNPYGIELPRLWAALLDSPVLPHLMVEHAPLSLAQSSGQLAVAVAVLYALMLAGVPLGRWRATYLVPAAWFVLTVSRVRNGPLFALAAGIAMAEMYADVRWRSWLVTSGSELLRLRSEDERASYRHWTPAATALPAALVALTIVLQAARVPLPVFGHGWARLDPGHWPVELLPDLRAFERSRPEGTGIFNEMLFGGFLIYETPGLRVFIDDRCELYGNDRLEEYRRAIKGETRWFGEWADRYGFEAALSVPGSTFDGWLQGSSDWEVVRATKAATLYRRRS